MSTTSSGPILPVRHGVLLPALRRDLTDLNDQYLDLGTAPGAEGDPRCAWSDEVRQCIREAGPATRAVMAAAPFALFELVIAARPGPPVAGRVADARSAGGSPLMHGRWISFAHQAAFLAWRLVDTAPLAARLTLGLAPPAQAGCPELLSGSSRRLYRGGFPLPAQGRRLRLRHRRSLGAPPAVRRE